jgi:hypothetical protein
MRQFLSRLVKYKKKTKKEDFFFPQLSSKCSVDSTTVSPVMSFVLSSRVLDLPLNQTTVLHVKLHYSLERNNYTVATIPFSIFCFYSTSTRCLLRAEYNNDAVSIAPPMYYQLVRRKTCCSGHSYILYMGRGCSFRIVRMWYYVFKR